MTRRIVSNQKELPPEIEITDVCPSMLRELFSIRHPSIKKDAHDYSAQQARFAAGYSYAPLYIHYPAQRRAIRILGEQEYFELRTARNKEVITAEEQSQYRDAVVGIAGLSVGSAVLQTLVQTGGPRRLKIADFDVVETTNLNRLRASLPDLGKPKVVVAEACVYDLDPFAEVETFPDGITDKNIESFITSPRLDALVDEMETIPFKIRMRLIAKRSRIPVVMATDNGNGVVLDVERFDLEPERPLFHGLVPLTDPEALTKLTYRDWLTLATQIVGPEYLGDRMRDSILSIGKTIPSVPQLGSSASFAGAAVSYAVRLILTKASMPSGRYACTMEELVDPDYRSLRRVAERSESAKRFLEQLSL